MAKNEKRKKVRIDLPVEMSETETAQMGQEVGKLVERIAKLETEKKAENTKWKEEILNPLQVKRDELHANLANGTINKKVPCEEVTDFDNGVKEIWRLDGNKPIKVSDELLQPEERQEPIPGTRRRGAGAEESEEGDE